MDPFSTDQLLRMGSALECGGHTQCYSNGEN